MSAPTIKITYFQGKGSAESTRLALTIGGFEFEDVRLQREEFMALKPTLPLGSLPIMEYNGKVYAQSGGMLRAAGALSGLYPSEPEQILAVEQVLGTLDDAQKALYPSFVEQDAEKKLEMRKEFMENAFPRYMGGLEKLLGEEYAAGDKLTIADLAIYVQVSTLSAGFLDGIPTDCVEQFPKMSAIAKKVGEHPAVQKWNEAHK